MDPSKVNEVFTEQFSFNYTTLTHSTATTTLIEGSGLFDGSSSSSSNLITSVTTVGANLTSILQTSSLSSTNTLESASAAAAASASAVATSAVSSIATTVYYNSSYSNSSSNETDPSSPSALPPIQAIIVSVILLVVILGTVVGNVLVCVAVCLVRKLRRPCNYLLVSLAVSDLCVAVLVMPTALLYEVLKKWTFGPVFCDIWVSFDVLCCTASILNLCAISVDRYWAITKPLEYGVKRTPRRMMMCVGLVWLAAACISLPPLLIMGNEHLTEDGEALCAVCQNFGYQIYATLGSFYIPLTVMLFVYYQIFRAARRIVMDEKRAQTRLENALNGSAQEKQIDSERGIISGGGGMNCTGGGGHGGGHGGHGGGLIIGSPHQKKLRFQLAKERKASTTLGIIMSAFTICWLPFFILALVRPFLEKGNHHIPETLSSLFLWLGYANSLLNPIIYATLNRDFRKPFQEILYFRCSSLNIMMREDFYHSQYGEPPSQRVVLGGEGQGARESFL